VPDIQGSYRSMLEYEEDPVSDHDLDWGQYLRFHAQPLLSPKNSFHFFGRVRTDFDHESSVDEAFARSDHRIFQAYGEFRDWLPSTRLRLGRQWIHEVEAVHLDGIRAEWLDAGPFDFMGFAGRPVSAYSSTDGHQVFGGEVRYEPWNSTLFRVTGVRNDEDHPAIDDQVGLHWDQYWVPGVRTYAEYTFLNERGKEFRTGGTAFIHPLQVELSGSYYRRVNRSPVPERDDIDSRRFSEFYYLLGESEELERYGLTATRFFGEHFSILTGWSQVSILGKDNPSNRNTDRYYGTLSWYDFPIKKMDLSLTGNYVRAKYTSDLSYTVDHAQGTDEVNSRLEGDEETFVITGQLDYELSRAVEMSVGSAYGDYDFSTEIELNQTYSEEFLQFSRNYLVSGMGGQFITRTFFAEIRWKIRDNLTTRLLGEWDQSEVSANQEDEGYGRLVAGLTWRF